MQSVYCKFVVGGAIDHLGVRGIFRMKILKILSSAIFCAAGLAALGASAEGHTSFPLVDPYFDMCSSRSVCGQLLSGWLRPPAARSRTRPSSAGSASETFRNRRPALVSGKSVTATTAFNGPPIIAGTTTPELIVERDINATISQVVSTTALAGVTYTLDVDWGSTWESDMTLIRISRRRGPSVAAATPLPSTA